MTVSSPGADPAYVEERYRRAPQLREYDRNDVHLRPYVTFAARPHLRTPVFSTDADGFRVSTSPSGDVDTGGWVAGGGGGLVLGGSFTFGVGATRDGATLPSRLAALLGTPQLNLGICAGNSTQELISAIPFLELARTVCVCGGANTILAALQSAGLNETYGPLFFEVALARLGAAPVGGLGPASGRTGPARPAPARRRLDMEGRLEAGLRRQVRDLRILSRALPDGSRLLFCLQPFAVPPLRDLVPEERELHDLHAAQQGWWLAIRDFLAARWESCGRRLAADCAGLGVSFLDLAADRFTGWSFLDSVHMTDAGYQQAAALVAEALC